MPSGKKKKICSLFRSELASDLRSFARALKDFPAVVRNPGLLDTAANDIERFTGTQEWKLDVVGELLINPEHPSDVLPQGAKLGVVGVSCGVEGHYPGDGPDYDRLTKMVVNLVLSGQSDERELFFCWHFDRHIGAQTGNLMHPRYHVQHAGHRMEHLDYDWGQAIFHDAPRLVHPPLDFILATDLALANFAPTAWQDLRGNPNYSNSVDESIKRLWRPYLSGLLNNSNCALDLWPNLFPS